MDVSAWNVAKGTNFSSQFYKCEALTTLDVTNWNVAEGTSFSSQFRGCRGLTTLDVSLWNVGKGTRFSRINFLVVQDLQLWMCLLGMLI